MPYHLSSQGVAELDVGGVQGDVRRVAGIVDV
jgi:hypothetical protein